MTYATIDALHGAPQYSVMTNLIPIQNRRPAGRADRVRSEDATAPHLKMLPWLAARHGVPPARAEELWRQACALADLAHGADARTPEYWAHAIRVLLRLLRCDGAALLAPDEVEQPPALPTARSALTLIDSQRRLGVAAFDAAAAFVHAANEYWSRALQARAARR